MHTEGLSRFENKRIMVIGDIMLDEFIDAVPSGTSAEYANTGHLHIQHKNHYPGGAANVALNIRKLKAIPYLVGTIGNDESARILLDLLQQENVSTEYLFTNTAQRTTRKTRLFKNGTPLLRLDEEDKGPYDKVVYDVLLKHIHQAITAHKPHAIILQDYNKGVLDPYLIKKVLKLAQEHALPVCVDPKMEHWEHYQQVDLFKPNKKEFLFMSESENERESGKGSERELENESRLEAMVKRLQEKIHYKKLLVTLGSEGNFIYDGLHAQFTPQHLQLNDPDVCGAGDTVIAAATLALICGYSLDAIAALANKAGYLACSYPHIHAVTLEELDS